MKKNYLLLACLLIAIAGFSQTKYKKHKVKSHSAAAKANGAAISPRNLNTTGKTGTGIKTGKGQQNGNGGVPAPPATPSHPPQ
jgi:hypothetical protein